MEEICQKSSWQFNDIVSQNIIEFFGHHNLVWWWSYQAGVLLFFFGCISSPAYLSELVEYLYVGGKYIFPSFHPTNTRPLFCSILNCQEYWFHKFRLIALLINKALEATARIQISDMRKVEVFETTYNCTWSHSNKALQFCISTSALAER